MAEDTALTTSKGRKRRTSSAKALHRRAARLFPHVGRAVFAAQGLELVLNFIITLVNRHRAAGIDKDALFELPASKYPLGPLIKAVKSVHPRISETFEDTLAKALDARNYVAHHCFVHNMEALESDAGYEAIRVDLLFRTVQLTVAAKHMGALAIELVKALGLQDTELRTHKAELELLPTFQAIHAARRRKRRQSRAGPL